MCLTHCNNSPYIGYTKIGDGLYSKIITFGDSGRRPAPGEFIKYSFASLSQPGDDKSKIRYMGIDELEDAELQQALLTVAENDSVHFIFCKGEDSSDVRKIAIRLLGIYNSYAELCAAKKNDQWRKDMEMREREKLGAWLMQNGISHNCYNKGIYYIAIEKGRGRKVKQGRRVSICYTGSFLNGQVFDSSATIVSPLDFTFGNPDQVIEGMERGLGMMAEGGKAKIIIPSQLAFGERGSSTGIVPPYTTVIYELYVLGVE
ncbi:MAG: FKBP-type peptidyl-prolyl cis-trans isomerase [Flavobacteriales bacterium]